MTLYIYDMIATPLPLPEGLELRTEARKIAKAKPGKLSKDKLEEMVEFLRTMVRETVMEATLALAVTAVNMSARRTGLEAWNRGKAFFYCQRPLGAWMRAVLHPSFLARMEADLRRQGGSLHEQSRFPSTLMPACSPYPVKLEHEQIPGFMGIYEGIELFESPHCAQVGAQEYASMLVSEGGIGIAVAPEGWVITEEEGSLEVSIRYAVWVADESRVHAIYHPAHPSAEAA